MTQELPEREALIRLPRPKPLAHIPIEVNSLLLNEGECSESRDELADGCGLEERFRGNWNPAAAITNAIRASPGDVTVLDDGEAHRGNAVVCHALDDRRTLPRLALRHGTRKQATFNARDAGILGDLTSSGNGRRRKKDEKHADNCVAP